MSWYRFRGPFDSLKPKKTVKFQVSSDRKSTHRHHKISIRIIIIIIIYYILYTIYYILYTIYYILYTINFILYTLYFTQHFHPKYTRIWPFFEKISNMFLLSSGCYRHILLGHITFRMFLTTFVDHIDTLLHILKKLTLHHSSLPSEIYSNLTFFWENPEHVPPQFRML